MARVFDHLRQTDPSCPVGDIPDLRLEFVERLMMNRRWRRYSIRPRSRRRTPQCTQRPPFTPCSGRVPAMDRRTGQTIVVPALPFRTDVVQHRAALSVRHRRRNTGIQENASATALVSPYGKAHQLALKVEYKATGELKPSPRNAHISVLNWRRERDSNPRDDSHRLHTFQACAFNRSATPPRGGARARGSGGPTGRAH
jgi:hypothetical protein